MCELEGFTLPNEFVFMAAVEEKPGIIEGTDSPRKWTASREPGGESRDSMLDSDMVYGAPCLSRDSCNVWT